MKNKRKNTVFSRKRFLLAKRVYVLPLAFVLLFILVFASSICPTASAGKYGDGCPYDNWYNGTIHGGIYFQIKGHYDDAGATQNYTFENVPDGRKIVRFYPGIWLGSRGSMEYINWTITINGHTDSYSVKENASNDPWCNALDEPECKMDITGCGVCSLCYNASSYIVTGTNNISFWTSEQIYHAALLVIYEDESMPEIQYWVKEGGQMYPGTGFSEYFNETVNTGRIYTGSIESVKFWSHGHPHCVGTCSKSGFPTLNGNDIDAPDYVYTYDANGNIYEGSPPGKEYTVFGRWNNVPPDYLTRPNNLIYYPNLYDNRLMAPVIMLNYSEPSELNVTNISPQSLYADPDETGRYANVINATVVNNGGTANFFNLTFFVNDTVVDVKRVTNLGEGESRVVCFLWAPNQTGAYELNVTADVENIVKETDETNNSKTLDVEVTIASPPEWQSQSSNVNSIPSGGTIELRAQGKAGTGLHNATLATDETGTWENITDGWYGSPMDMASLYNHSFTHTSESDWNNQTLENLTAAGEDVKLYQLIGTDNLALNKDAYANSTYSTYIPANAVDGDNNTFWRGPNIDFPNWWKVDLGEVKEIKKIYIDFYYRTVPCKYEVLISNDNETWTKKIEKSVGHDETYTGLDWSCRYINISIIESYYTGTPRAGINEFEAYGAGNYTPTGTLTSSTIETSNPVVAVTPTWNAINSTNTSISVNVSVDDGTTWKPAVNGTELTWDYDVHNTSLKYKVLFETTNVNETPVLHDITLNYMTRDPIEGEWLWSNFSWQNPSVANKTVGWKIYYEDMLGQTNCTDVMTFEVGAPGPAIELVREQANTTGLNQETTVRLVVWNTDSSVSNVTSLNLTEWIDPDWKVTDCGNCYENTSTYIKWTLGDLARDNYTMVSYKIRAPANNETSTFKANCTYKYNGQTGSAEGSGFNVSVETGKAFFDFELDMDASTPAIDRDVPEGTEKTVNYTVTNIGDAVPCDTVFIELKINKTAWDVTCAYCDEFYNDTDYYYLRWIENGSSWTVQQTKVFNFTVNSSHVGYYNFASNGTYDPPASANAFIGQIYYPVLLLEEIGVGEDINGSDEPNASDVVPPTPIDGDDNSSLPHDDSATEHEEENILYNDVNETFVTEIVEVTCNVQEQKQVLNIEAKLVYDVNETPIPNQEICFYRDTALIGSELTNGEGWAAVSCDTSELPAGNYTINVIYEGDETLSNVAQRIKITLVSPTPTPTPTATAANETANETQEPQNITDDLTSGPPIVTLISPTNTTYNNTEIELNYTVNAPADWVAYSLNGLDNVTITGEGSTTLNASIGLNTLTVYANDSFGNMGSACVQFVVNLTNVTATVPEPENITAEITPVLVAMKEHFPLNEKPAFKFKFSVNAFSKRVGLKTLATPTETIKTAVYYKDELVDIEPEIEELREGEFCIEIPTKRAFQAGLYKLRVELVKDNVTYVEEQDFTWGVLAINTHKSIYLPNETAFIGIAVLDDEGHMVCDAAITLTITDPSNKETVLSTSNGLIKVSPECSVYGVTNLPDYYTNYEVAGVGTYTMDLTAVTPDGTKSITDEFTVQNSVDFDVARDGPTRIYPPVPYVMNFIIKANKNYTGLIKEYVPASFVITPQQGLTVTTVGDTKILTWNEELVKGEVYNIYYEFDAPDISPYLFVLGALEVGNFKEARKWQIASDARQLVSVTLTSPANNSEYSISTDTFIFTCHLDYGGGAAAGTTGEGNWTYCAGIGCTPNINLTSSTGDLTGDDADGQFSCTNCGDSDYSQTVTANTAGTYNLQCGATDQNGPWLTSAIYTITVTPDTTPPASITNLQNTTYASTYINWSWTNPADADFNHTMVYINGNWEENVSSPLNYSNATGLSPNINNTISTHTVDTSGNVNLTWVNHSAWTAPSAEKIWVTNIEVHFVRVKSAAAMDTTPPASITNPHNTTYASTYINWSWTNPEDADFSHVMVYIDGTFKENVFSPSDYYNATGFTANTQHIISTHTVDTTGNVNLSWVNHSAWTAPAPAGAPTVEIITITPDDDSLTSGVQINPVPNSTKTVNITAHVSDPNGYDNISTVKITDIVPDPTSGDPSPVTLSFQSGSGTTATYEGTFDMQFYDASETYTVTVTATDTGDLTGSNSSSFEYQTCIALELDVASIDFDLVDPGSYKEVIGDPVFPNAAPTIKNSGNVVIDMKISGTNMNGSGTIPVNNISDDLNNPDGYSALSTTPTEHDELNLTAGANSAHGIDFKLNVPSGTSAGNYFGTVTLEAKMDD